MAPFELALVLLDLYEELMFIVPLSLIVNINCLLLFTKCLKLYVY